MADKALKAEGVGIVAVKGPVRAAEQGFGCKLLRSTIGGSGGGGAQLTDEARQIMEAYDAYCRKLDAYGKELFRELFGFCTEK